MIVLQILPPDLWPRIDEAARLRAEGKVLSSIDAGEFDPWIGETNAEGAIGTWAADFLQHFSSDLWAEVWQVFSRKLEGEDVFERAYIGRFFIKVIPPVYNTSGRKCAGVLALCAAVTEEEPWMREALSRVFWSYPEDWRNAIREKLQNLEVTDPDFYRQLVEQEIPF
jgi:hypothetical protein